MAVSQALLTVAEFARLPQPQDGRRQELHHGEIFELPPVKKLHTWMQMRLLGLLSPGLSSLGLAADKEFPFRPTPEYEVWVADIALFSAAEWDGTAFDDYYHGVPPVVIEVLSPSNTASEMLSRESICLKNGGLEFWLVDPKERTVRISLASGHSSLLHTGETCLSPTLQREFPVESFFPPLES